MTDMKYQRLADRLRTALHGLDDGAILRCFDPRYVRFVLSVRIEQHIIEQCQGHGPAPIGSGRLSETLGRSQYLRAQWAAQRAGRHRPATDLEARGRRIRERLADFARHLADVCKHALPQASAQTQ